MVKNDNKQLPSIYLELTQNLSSIGEHDLAQQVCERGLVRFPDNTNLHCLRGGILVNIFNTTKDQKYLSEALLSYEKSLSLNSANYLSALTAAKIYIKSSAFTKAKEKLKLIFTNSPGDAKATDLLNLLNEKEKVIEKSKDKKAPSLFESVEEIDDRATNLSANYDLLVSQLRLFRRIEGLRMILLTDMYGVVLKCVNKTELDINRFGIAISNIYRSSRDAIQQTALGVFRQGVLITPEGHFYIVAADSAMLVIVAEENANHKDIEDQIQLYLQEIST